MTPEDEQLAKAFGLALSKTRLRLDLARRDLGLRVSSYGYLTALENGTKQPTIGKVDEIACELGVHPLTLLMLAYQARDAADPFDLMLRIKMDLSNLEMWPTAGFAAPPADADVDADQVS